jgi:hypothetical protein
MTMTMTMAYLLKKRRSALPISREKGGMTMATFPLPSVNSCEGGHGLCHHLLEKRGSGLLGPRGKEHDHGHLPPFLSKEMLRWSWHIF